VVEANIKKLIFSESSAQESAEFEGSVTLEQAMAIGLADRNNWMFNSKFEASVAVALDFFGMSFSFHEKSFSITSGGRTIKYSPDFIVANGDGTKVLLEPHGSAYIDKRFLSKMNAFMSSPFSSEYYTILIVDVDPSKPNRLYRELEKNGYSLEQVCDEMWNLPYKANASEDSRGYRTNIYTLLRKLKDDEPIAQHERSRVRARHE
jgi:hypothetical protein